MTSHYSKYGDDYASMGPTAGRLDRPERSERSERSERLERSHGSSSSMMASPPGRGAIVGDRLMRETPFTERDYQDRMMIAGGGGRDGGRRGDRDRSERDRDRGDRDRDRDHDRRRGGEREKDKDIKDPVSPGRRDPSALAPSKSAAELEADKEREEAEKKKAAEEREAERKKEERKATLKKMGTVDILKGIKSLDDKKGEAQKDIETAASELETLEASLPKLLKTVERLSKKEPNFPMFTKDVSEEELSSDSSMSSSSDDDDDSAKKKRTGEKTKNLQKRLESIAPEQRRLLNRLGACLREQALRDCVSEIAAQNAAIVARTSGGASGCVDAVARPADVDAAPAPAQPTTPHAAAPPTTSRYGHLGYDPSLSGDEVKARLQAAFGRKADEATMSSVKRVLEKDLRRTLSVYVLSAIKYRLAFEAHTEARLEKERERERELAHEEEKGAGTSFNATNSLASPSRGERGGRGGVVRSDLEERLAIATLQAVEAVKSMTTLPTQVVATERTSRWVKDYRDWNRLVADPKAAFEMSDVFRPWSQREKDVFAEKFLLYHKDFARIAKFLPNRTVPEIVKFFYSVQRSEEFEITRRKWQLRKRREKGGVNDGVAGGGDGRTTSGRTDFSGGGGGGIVNTSGTNNLDGDVVMDDAAIGEMAEIRRILQSSAAAAKRRGGRTRGAVGWSDGGLASLLAMSTQDDGRFVGGYESLVAVSSPAPGSSKKKRAKKAAEGAKGPKGAKGAKASKSPRNLKSPKDPKKAPTKRAPARKKNPDQPTAVGRGRLPSAETDKKFLDAVQIHGKDFVGIGSYINKTPEAAKKYWERHCDRLGLDKRVGMGAGSGSGGGGPEAGGPITAAPIEAGGPITASPIEAPSVAATAAVAETAAVAAATAAPPGTKVVPHPTTTTSITPAPATTKKRPREGKIWSEADKQALFNAYAAYGRDWAKMHEAVPSKTLTQVKNFYQNYKEKFVLSQSGAVAGGVGGAGGIGSPPKKQPKAE